MDLVHFVEVRLVDEIRVMVVHVSCTRNAVVR